MKTREKIAAMRRYRNIKQSQAAAACGVSITTYCARENGTTSEFLAEDLHTLSKLFDVPVAELLGDE